MAIPEAVQRQADEADRLIAEIQERDKNPAPEQQQQAVAEPPPEQEKQTDWEHKYSVLQGKYNAEVPRLNQQMHELRNEVGQIDSLKAQIAELQKKPEVKAPEFDVSSFREDFGDTGADALEAMNQRMDRLAQENAELRQSVGQTQQSTQQSSEQMFYSALDSKVNDWKEVNTDPRFIEWLNQPDGFSGKTRQELMNEGAATMDVDRVSTFFTEWKKTGTKPNKSASPRTQNTNSTPAQGRSWNSAEIEAVYRDIAHGKYPEDEAKQIELDIHKAQMEGRISA